MPETSREEFLQAVRRALGRGNGPPDPPNPLLGERLQEVRRRVREVEARLAERRHELVERLAEMAPKAGWNLLRAPDHEQALLRLRNLAEQQGWRRGVYSDHDVFHRLRLGTLNGPSLRLRLMALGFGGSRESLRKEAAEADVGVTGVDYAVAETATAVLLARQGVSRLVSLLPPVHVAVVEPAQVIANLDDLFLLRRLAYHQGGMDMGSYMSFITGPSRSADIEQTIVTGVHGPREVHLLLIG